MKFDELDKEMRVYETAHDHRVLPGVYMIARIDGRNFTRLTKKIHKFELRLMKIFETMVSTTAT